MKLFKISLIVIFLSLGIFACESSTEETTEESTETTEETVDSTASETAEETSESEAKATRGQVVTLGDAGEDGMLTIQVDHEEIPDFMMAMRMDLKVAQADVAELKEGDKISFEMVKMEEGGFMMQTIEKLSEDTELTLKTVE